MNSLLQALFMTPQVRQLLYGYLPPGDSLDYNIPF